MPPPRRCPPVAAARTKRAAVPPLSAASRPQLGPQVGHMRPLDPSQRFPGQDRRRGRRISAGRAAPLVQGPHFKVPETSKGLGAN
jgi:hypothetical protein